MSAGRCRVTSGKGIATRWLSLDDGPLGLQESSPALAPRGISAGLFASAARLARRRPTATPEAIASSLDDAPLRRQRRGQKVNDEPGADPGLEASRLGDRKRQRLEVCPGVV